MITPSQLRAARALLDWSRAECAEKVGISPETVKNIEQEKFEPSAATLEKILKTFASFGVDFFTQHGVALRDTETQPAAEANTAEDPDAGSEQEEILKLSRA